ncbi:MAG TPA: hypothetical protein EYH13_05310 [Thermococcus paralvinellae]|uniref:Uncharacterized protein n=1 Tax=Thermococcus paralvinellae TaxID=582419 RepID=A0A832Z665_9EURY|nr:hypothetical protein [Thermococcus paralvinellae]
MKFGKILTGIMAGAIAGVGVFTIWPSMLSLIPWFGGFIAAGIIITTAFLLNHYVSAFPNEEKTAWVDMALSIWLSALLGGIVGYSAQAGGIVRVANGIFNGANILGAIPTIVLEIIGASIGGYLIVAFERSQKEGGQ